MTWGGVPMAGELLKVIHLEILFKMEKKEEDSDNCVHLSHEQVAKRIVTVRSTMGSRIEQIMTKVSKGKQYSG